MQAPVTKRGSPVTSDRVTRSSSNRSHRKKKSSIGVARDTRINVHDRPPRPIKRTPISAPDDRRRPSNDDSVIKDNPIRPRRGSNTKWTAYHIIVAVWLIVLTVLVIVVWRAPGNTTTAKVQTERQSGAPSDNELPNSILHHYPFNIYDATPGHVMRYPSANGSGIHGIIWNALTWYKVCCKHENAFRCYPPQHAVLRNDFETARVYLELLAVQREKGNIMIGEIGSRCNLYWSEDG